MALGEDEVVGRFALHQTTPESKILHEQLRIEFTEFGLMLDEMLPDGREKSLAFTHLEDVAMRAHRAVSHPNPLL